MLVSNWQQKPERESIRDLEFEEGGSMLYVSRCSVGGA